MRPIRFLAPTAMVIIFIAACGCCCCNPSAWPSGNDNSYGWASPSPGPYYPTYAAPYIAAPSFKATSSSPPISLPTGTYLKRSLSGGDGELEISNGLDEDAVIMITGVSNPRNALDSVYVRAEDTFTVDGIPDGHYDIYYMTGTDWNPVAGKFNNAGVYKKFEDAFDYTTTADEYTNWQIEIKPMAGGNANTDYVSPANFPA